MTEQGVRFDSDGCAFVGTCLEAEYPTAAALLITGSGKTGPDRQSIGPRGYSRAGRLLMSSEVLDLISPWAMRHWGPAPTPAADQRET
jgi:hypothetical protein